MAQNEYEMTYKEVTIAFMLLRPVGQLKLPLKAALKVRKLHYSLKTEANIRDEMQNKILEENDCLKETGGWKVNENGTPAFKTKKGEKEGQKQLQELNETKVKITMVPLVEQDFSTANGLTIEPSLLISLEEARLLTLD